MIAAMLLAALSQAPITHDQKVATMSAAICQFKAIREIAMEGIALEKKKQQLTGVLNREQMDLWGTRATWGDSQIPWAQAVLKKLLRAEPISCRHPEVAKRMPCIVSEDETCGSGELQAEVNETYRVINEDA